MSQTRHQEVTSRWPAQGQAQIAVNSSACFCQKQSSHEVTGEGEKERAREHRKEREAGREKREKGVLRSGERCSRTLETVGFSQKVSKRNK